MSRLGMPLAGRFEGHFSIEFIIRFRRQRCKQIKEMLHWHLNNKVHWPLYDHLYQQLRKQTGRGQE